MGARPVKNSIWFELGVAAYFSTQPIKIDNCTIDLNGAQVDPNHRPYHRTKIITGYLSEIDITITKVNWQYNISCKFTEQSDMTLKPDSRDFLKAVLELMSLYLIEEDYSEIQMRYFLVTNFVISQALNAKNKFTEAQFENLSKNLLKIGEQSGIQLNEEQFKPDKLKAFLPLLIIYPITTLQIENLLKDNADFVKAHKVAATNLLHVPLKGLLLNQIIKPDLTLFCDSQNHTDCVDYVVQKKLCHIGNLSKIANEVNQVLSGNNGEILTEIPIEKLGIHPEKMISTSGIAPETISHITALILNNQVIFKTNYSYTFYVLPASFTIFAFDAFKLAKKIEETIDDNKRVYPSKVPELSKLNIGFKAIQEIIQLAYLKGLNYRLPKNEIIFDSNEDFL